MIEPNDVMLDIRRAIIENATTIGAMLAYLVQEGVVDKPKFDRLRAMMGSHIDQEIAQKDHEMREKLKKQLCELAATDPLVKIMLENTGWLEKESPDARSDDKAN